MLESAEPQATSRPRRARRRPLHEDIQSYLIGMGLRSGDPMPSELELCQELGVSRGTLREALKQLEALGIVETRHGTGMFIAPFSLAPLVNGLVFHGKIAQPEEALAHLMQLAEVRSTLECQLVRRVAVDVDDASLAAIRESFRALAEDSSDSLGMDDADLRFHDALYRGLGNSLVIDLVAAFWEVLRILRPRLADNFADHPRVIDKHAGILKAIESRDPDAAEAAMRLHFAGTLAWLESSRTP